MTGDPPLPLVGPLAERAFYVDEFAGHAIVVALPPDVGPVGEVRSVLTRAAATLAGGGSRLVVVAGGSEVARFAAALPGSPSPLLAPSATPDADWLADLWLAATDGPAVVVSDPSWDGPRTVALAAELAVSLRALKLVIADPGGGWGLPPRSFADVSTHAEAYRSQLARRQGGAVVAAIEGALAGGVTSVNLCQAVDVDSELFTFDGAGTLFTSGGYLELAPLRVDDLTAVEELVAQGVADGALRPRDRHEVARLAVTGLGAKVVGSGHLAGIAGLEVTPYADQRVAELSSLYTVSRFSGAGAGGLLVDALVDRAAEAGLEAVFAVTVSSAAGAFFVRRGFEEVGQERVPPAKWDGYDPERRGQARVFWRPATAADQSF